MDYRLFGETFGIGLGPLDPTVPMGFIGYSQPTSTSATLTFEDGSVFRMKGEGLRFQSNGTGGWDLVGGTVQSLTQTHNGTTYAKVSQLDIDGARFDDVLELNQIDLVRLWFRGNDTSYGTRFADDLWSGRGADIVWGLGGADDFVYKAVNESRTTKSTRDTLADLRKAQGDEIDLSGIDARTNRSGNQAFLFIGDDRFSGRSGELRASVQDGVTVVRGDVNGDAVADFSIALGTSIALTENQFLL